MMTALRSLTLSATLLLTASAWGQSAQIPAPPQSQPIVIHNATVHTVANGVIEGDGYVVFENGVITAVGRGAPPEITNARAFDAAGLHVYPGLFASETTLGLVETRSVAVTIDTSELGTFNPEVRAAVAVNPDTDLIPVTRANGILFGMTFPQGGVISGRASLLRFDGWTWEDMAIDAEAGLAVNWPRTDIIPWISTSEAEQRRRVRESISAITDMFEDARRYYAAREADPTTQTDLRFEAMRAAIDREKPIFINASSASQIESAVSWANEQNVRIIIVGATSAERAIPVLQRHDIPVIVRGTHRLPGRRHDAYDTPFTLPAKLHEAGITFAIASGAEPGHERNLNHIAATAAAYGLPKEEALRAVTLSPARIFGVDDTYGSIEIGKSASLIITTGDPLEITTDTLLAFIDGRQIDLGNRHKRLYRKYLEKFRQLGLING